MTEMAQLQLLSHLDGTASLKPMWGGGFERGEPNPIIWIFTCNGRGPQQLDPPASLLPRFRSRCLQIPFAVPTQGELAIYLERVWAAERGPATPDGYFDFIASEGGGVRDALMRLEVDLLSGPRAVPVPAEGKLRTYYNEQGIPKKRQDAIIAEITAKARPGAKVGPFTIGAQS
jgi:hypothetical protein